MNQGIPTAARGCKRHGNRSSRHGPETRPLPPGTLAALSLGLHSDVPAASPNGRSAVSSPLIPLTPSCPSETPGAPKPRLLPPSLHATRIYFSSPWCVLSLPFFQGHPGCPCHSTALSPNCPFQPHRVASESLSRVPASGSLAHGRGPTSTCQEHDQPVYLLLEAASDQLGVQMSLMGGQRRACVSFWCLWKHLGRARATQLPSLSHPHSAWGEMFPGCGRAS